jgi:4'-phosphopantetheinyl transferase
MTSRSLVPDAGDPRSSDASGGRVTRRAVEIVFVDLDAAAAPLAEEEARRPRLSVADEQRADAIAEERTRRLWRASRIATRIVLERVGGQRLRRLVFRIEKDGRPVLGNGAPHFSISHCDGAALIAVTADMPVGVDLEEKSRKLKMSTDRRIRVVQAAARLGGERAFSADSDSDVLAAWVRLEAIAKARGTGIGRLLTEEGVVGGARSTSRRQNAGGIAVRGLDAGRDYVAAIAASELPHDLQVELFPTADIDAYLRD